MSRVKEDVQRVLFSCAFAEERVGTQTCVAFELHPSFLIVGSKRFAYKEWMHLLGRGNDLSDQTPTDRLEALKPMLILESSSRDPTEVKITSEPTEWTQTWSEGMAILAFDEIVQALKNDNRFRLTDAGPQTLPA